MKHYSLINVFAVVLLTACATSNALAVDEDERGILSTKMVNLSSAVNAYFSGLPSAPVDNDETILKNATQHDPRLLADEFKPYLLKTQYQNPYAVVLLCSADGKQAIMEDAGCSAQLDRQIKDDAPCEFKLHVTKGCEVEGADPK